MHGLTANVVTKERCEFSETLAIATDLELRVQQTDLSNLRTMCNANRPLILAPRQTHSQGNQTRAQTSMATHKILCFSATKSEIWNFLADEGDSRAVVSHLRESCAKKKMQVTSEGARQADSTRVTAVAECQIVPTTSQQPSPGKP